jgi:NhaP-type Na+/H+ and K+/H+ antiporter
VVGPGALTVSLLGTSLPWRERLTATWCRPKRFASVVYSLLALQSGLADAELLFNMVAVRIVLSIVLHSSTDVPIARMLRIEPPDNFATANYDSGQLSYPDQVSAKTKSAAPMDKQPGVRRPFRRRVIALSNAATGAQASAGCEHMLGGAQ